MFIFPFTLSSYITWLLTEYTEEYNFVDSQWEVGATMGFDFYTGI